MNASRQERKPYEARLIQLLKWRLNKSNFTVRDYQKVGELPLEIDVVAIPPGRAWRPDFAKFPRLFEYFRRYNVMEIKTERDRLKTTDLPKLMAYGWLYMAKNNIENVSEVTLTALIHHWTPRILKAMPKLGFVEKAEGIYWRESEPVAYVISFTKLPEELIPEELGIFCDAARRRRTLHSCLDDQEKAPIVETIFDLYRNEVKEYMKINIREDALRDILSVVPDDKIIAAMGEEKIIAAVGEEKIIATVGKEKILSAIGEEEIISTLDEDKIVSVLGRERIMAALERQRRSSKRPSGNNDPAATSPDPRNGGSQ